MVGSYAVGLTDSEVGLGIIDQVAANCTCCMAVTIIEDIWVVVDTTSIKE